MRKRIAPFMVLFSGLAVGAEPASALLEAPLETSLGARSELSAFAARPLVVFYEDRGSAGENQSLKDALFALGRTQGKLDAVAVVGVANLTAWNWSPAREFARAGVAEAEKKAGVPVLIDWKGLLTHPPLLLSDRQSTVLLIHRGEVLFRQAGSLSRSDSERFFAALGGAVEDSVTR